MASDWLENPTQKYILDNADWLKQLLGIRKMNVNPNMMSRGLPDVMNPFPNIMKSLADYANQEQQNRDASEQYVGNLWETGGEPLTPFEQFMQQYESINVPRTPYAELQKMAQQQVNAQYDPMITLLNQQMGQKKERAAGSQKEARDMYNALGESFVQQLPQMTNEFAQQDREANQRYDNAQASLQKQYGNQAAEQQALLERLGIQAAAPEASKQANEDQAYFQNQLELSQQQEQGARTQQNQAAKDYTQSLGNTSRMAGENTAQDIASQLEAYLDTAGGQLGVLQGQKGSALASLLQQMQAQDAKRAEDESQRQFENLLKLSRFQLDSEAMQRKMAQDMNQNLFEGKSSLLGAQNFLGQQYQNEPDKASAIMQELQDVLANPEVTQGKFILDPGDGMRAPTYSPMTQERMMEILRKEMAGGQYTPADINAAMNALAAYKGLLR